MVCLLAYGGPTPCCPAEVCINSLSVARTLGCNGVDLCRSGSERAEKPDRGLKDASRLFQKMDLEICTTDFAFFLLEMCCKSIYDAFHLCYIRYPVSMLQAFASITQDLLADFGGLVARYRERGSQAGASHAALDVVHHSKEVLSQRACLCLALIECRLHEQEPESKRQSISGRMHCNSSRAEISAKCRLQHPRRRKLGSLYPAKTTPRGALICAAREREDLKAFLVIDFGQEACVLLVSARICLQALDNLLLLSDKALSVGLFLLERVVLVLDVVEDVDPLFQVGMSHQLPIPTTFYVSTHRAERHQCCAVHRDAKHLTGANRPAHFRQRVWRCQPRAT